MASDNTISKPNIFADKSDTAHGFFEVLPRELRDQIYEHLAETEERIVLGWRFLQIWEDRDAALALDDCFDSAVALHPLSMTCKQMRAEFQNIHFTATKARWTLSVDNDEIATMLGVTTNVVGVQLTRARAMLRDLLNTGDP